MAHAMTRKDHPMVVSLDSVDEFEQARSEDVRYTLLMHDTRFASGGSSGVHHMLLSAPTMHTLRPTRLWHASGPLWSRSRHSSTAVHQVSGHVFGRAGHGVLRVRGGGAKQHSVDKATICDWVDRAGWHCRAVTTYLFDTLHITECQVDELWSFVRKKEAHLSVAEKVLALYGDAWVWIAFAPAWRLVAAFVVGKRDQAHANVLLERLHAVSCGYIPFFTSD